jgi:hypothetical protein
MMTVLYAFRQTAIVAVVCALVSASAPAGAQQKEFVVPPDWKPEKITNVQALPKDISPEDLVKLMKQYNESLNVGCVFCHVGPVEGPIEKYDFASDRKERHKVTRSMIIMTRDINTKYPEGMGDFDPVSPKTTCATCHRRNRHPETEPPPKASKP